MKAYRLINDIAPKVANNRRKTNGRKVNYQSIIDKSNGKVIKTIKHILK